MTPAAALELDRQQGLIFRLTHRSNVRWMLRHGLHCRNSATQDPDFQRIGNPDLINKRQTRSVPVDPRGTLADYVPFYFTPHSKMLLQIQTGHSGVPMLPKAELVFLIAELPKLVSAGHTVLVSDRHAMMSTANFRRGVDGLASIPWDLLETRSFAADPEHPDRGERYQAEALVHRLLPAAALSGLACNDPETEDRLRQHVADAGLSLRVALRPNFFF